MHFLLSFVKKDKQADSMLERLLVRLSTAQSLCQRRSLAYCISELTVTEKGIKKIAEMLRTIKDALYDEEVFDYVLKTVRSAKKEGTKAASSEDKKLTDELEKALMAIARDARGEEAEIAEQKTESASGDESQADGAENTAPVTEKNSFSLRDASKPAAKKTAAKGKTPTKKAKPKKKVVESDSDNDDEEEADFSEVVHTEKSAKTSSRRRAPLAQVN